MDTLSLRGDKIKLEVRTMSKDTATASAKCIYLMQGVNRSSRPVSAVPLLTLYQNSRDNRNSRHQLRRPYSADNLCALDLNSDCAFLKQVKTNGIERFANSCSSLHSIDDFEKDSVLSLPSSDLLKTLIDESITPRTNSEQRSESVESLVDFCDEDIDSVDFDNITDAMRRGKHQTKRQSKTAAKLAQMKVQAREAPRTPCEPSTSTSAAEPRSEGRWMSLPPGLSPGLTCKPPLPRNIPKATSSSDVNQPSTMAEMTEWSQLKYRVYENKNMAAIRKSMTQVNLHMMNTEGPNRSDSSDVQLDEKLYRQPAYQVLATPRPSCSTNTEPHRDHLFGDAAKPMRSISGSEVESEARVPPLMHDLFPHTMVEESARSQKKLHSRATRSVHRTWNTSSDSASPMAVSSLCLPSTSRVSSTKRTVIVVPTAEGGPGTTIICDVVPTSSKKGPAKPEPASVSGLPVEHVAVPADDTPQAPIVSVQSCLTNPTMEHESVQSEENNSQSIVATTDEVETLLQQLAADNKQSNKEIKKIRVGPEHAKMKAQSKRSASVHKLSSLEETPKDVDPPKKCKLPAPGPKAVDRPKKLKMPKGTSKDVDNIKKAKLPEKEPEAVELPIMSKSPEESPKDVDKPEKFNQPEVPKQVDQPSTSKVPEEAQPDNLFEVSNNKFQAIIEYLNSVEQNPKEPTTSTKPLKRIQISGGTKAEDLLCFTPAELAEEIIAMYNANIEKSATIMLLDEELQSYRGSLSDAQERAKQLYLNKYERVKGESELALKRHQHLISELMKDKSALQTNCQTLLEELEVMKDRHENNFKAMEHKYEVEMKKALGMQLANEKSRRERWIEARAEKIKELSIKSVEPEIQAITTRHERELKEIEDLHKRQLQEVEEKSLHSAQMQIEIMREQYTREREELLSTERDHLRKRYETMLKSEEDAYNQHRKRLVQDHMERVAECEAREKEVYCERDKCISLVKTECAEKLRVAEERHERAINIILENAKYDCDKWKKSFEKQQEAEIAKKQEEIYANAKQERNKEIETVITRLETEMHRAKLQLTATADSRVKRLTEKYESELKDLETSVQEYKAKYLNFKTKKLEAEEQIASLQSAVKHLETQLTIAIDKCDKLVREKEESEKKYNKDLHQKMLQLQEKVEMSNKEKREELTQLYSRVKLTVQRKEQTITELNSNYAALKSKYILLENKLEQQRKNFYIQ